MKERCGRLSMTEAHKDVGQPTFGVAQHKIRGKGKSKDAARKTKQKWIEG